MSDDLHLANLDGFYVAIRDEAVAWTRGLHADFAETTYGDSRLVPDAPGLLALMERTNADFAIVPTGEDIVTEVVGESGSIDRLRRYTLRLIVGERPGDKSDEDLFFNRLELLENRWGARSIAEVTVDGLAVEFRVSIESASPLVIDTNESSEAIGHATERRIIYEVNACAS